MAQEDSSTQTQDRRDFFLSSADADRAWADWIAAQLEAAHLTVFLPAWDIRPGHNLALALDTALATTRRALLLCSAAALADEVLQAQWSSVFQRDPTGAQRRLIPVLVEECLLSPLLAGLAPLDLRGLDEPQARARLLSGVQEGRIRPAESPFPGAVTSPRPSVVYPGRVPLVWNIPYARNPYFTGREEPLQALHRRLKLRRAAAVSQPQTINGLGGIGKTQLAVEYAWRHRAEYAAVLWVRADTTETLNASYSEVAELLHLAEQQEREQARVVQAVKGWLRTHRDYLLILDNADTPELLLPFVPLDAGGHLLITTRTADLSDLGLGVDEPSVLEALTREQGAHLLLQRAGRSAAISPEERALAEEIAGDLGGLPLALDQAGAYIRSSSISLVQYHSLFQQDRMRLLQEHKNRREHPEPVTTTWNLSFRAVEEQNAAAADLLRLCSFLAPEAIPEGIVVKGASLPGSVLAPVAADALWLYGAIATLRKYSLLERNAEEETISVHRLVQEVIRESVPAEEKRRWKQYAVEAVGAAWPGLDFANWSALEQWLPHALVALSWIREEEKWGHEAAPVFSHVMASLLFRGQLGQTLEQQNDLAGAEREYRRAIDMEQALGDAVISSTNHSRLAELLLKQNKLTEAEAEARIALACALKGEDAQAVGQALIALAQIRHQRSDYPGADTFFQQALRWFEYEELHNQAASASFRYANLLEQRNEIQRSQIAFHKAQEHQRIGREKELG